MALINGIKIKILEKNTKEHKRTQKNTKEHKKYIKSILI